MGIATKRSWSKVCYWYTMHVSLPGVWWGAGIKDANWGNDEEVMSRVFISVNHACIVILILDVAKPCRMVSRLSRRSTETKQEDHL